MKYAVFIILSYLVGSLNPAALISKIKNVNLREHGSGNIGGLNTMLVLGKGYGALVMIFDIAKSFVAFKLAQHLFPEISFAGILASLAVMIGHIFPVYMHFKGGKGLAAFGGLVLAYDYRMFLPLLFIAGVLMLITNKGVALIISAAVLFPVLVWLTNSDISQCLTATGAALLVIAANLSVAKRSFKGEFKFWDYTKRIWLKK